MNQLEKQLLRNFSRFHRLAAGVMKDVPGGYLPGKTGPGKGRFIVMSAALRIYRESKDHRVRVGDIVDELHIPAPAVSRALKDLEADGVLVRQTDPEDRRITLVTFTERGMQQVRACTDAVDGLFDRITDRMGEMKVRQLCDLMEEFYTCTEKAVRGMTGDRDDVAGGKSTL